MALRVLLRAVAVAAILMGCGAGTSPLGTDGGDADADADADADTDADADDPAPDRCRPWDTAGGGESGSDEDSDGFTIAGGDCDDLDASVHPGANDNQGLMSVVVDEAPAIKSSLWIDGYGRPHVRYSLAERLPETDQDGNQIGWRWEGRAEKLATVVRGAFIQEDFPFWRNAAIAVGPDGATHAVMEDFREPAVRDGSFFHSVSSGGGWSEPEVMYRLGPGEESYWGFVGVEVDPCGAVHVLRTGRTISADFSVEDWLLYLTNSTGAWTSEKVVTETASVSRFSRYSGPRIDRQGTLSAFQHSIDAGGPADVVRWLTKRPEGAWTATTAREGNAYELDGEIGLTRSGKPRQAYTDGAIAALHVLALDETWTDELVSADLPYQGGLAIWPEVVLLVDSADVTHVLHHAEETADVPFTGPLREWLRTTDGWSERSPVTIDGALSAAVAPSGAIHLVYNALGGGLAFATRLEGLDGVDQNCDGVDGVDADGDGVASVDTGGRDGDDEP